MAGPAVLTTSTTITTEGAGLDGDLTLPPHTRGVVLVAHGSGSSRRSPRNRLVAEVLNRNSLSTLLVDLLTADEEVRDARTRDLRFDVGLLADRLAGILDWLGGEPETAGLPVGLFGAGTGAAAALVAASQRRHIIRAVVSRGGRPDLAGAALPRVHAATLLIVGGHDKQVIALNEDAYRRLNCAKRMDIIPGATHLFEEPGALESVSRLARRWFEEYLVVTLPENAAPRQAAW